MAVNRVPVLKRCRSLDLDPTFLGYDKKSKRTSARAGKKMSEYGLQLREKQKAKFIYGVLEKPFRNYYDRADRMKGQTGSNLMTILESRLDNVVFRMGFAATRREARQLVNHGHFLVNGKKADIPSMELKAGDVVSVKAKSQSSPKFNELKEMIITTPAWIDLDLDKFEGKIIRTPEREDVDLPIEEHYIVEFYSR